MLREMLSEEGSHDTELTHVKCMCEAEKHLADHAVDIIFLARFTHGICPDCRAQLSQSAARVPPT